MKKSSLEFTAKIFNKLLNISDAQFAGDADDYDSLEYGDDEVESPDLQAW